MPRASWSGFLRLSLVSCPVYLSPATTRTKSLRLHQVWRPAAADEPGPEEPDRDRDGQVGAGSRPQPADPRETERAGQATRIALRPHDPRAGEEIAKSAVVKGYEYGRGQFVTFTAEELKALDVERSGELRAAWRHRRRLFRQCVLPLPRWSDRGGSAAGDRCRNDRDGCHRHRPACEPAYGPEPAGFRCIPFIGR